MTALQGMIAARHAASAADAAEWLESGGIVTEPKSDKHGDHNEMGDFVQGARESANPHVFNIKHNCVSDVQIKGVKERWIAPVALLTFPKGLSENSWAIIPETAIGFRLHGATLEDHGRRVTRTSGPGRDFMLQLKGEPRRYLASGAFKLGKVFLSDSLLDRASETENRPALSDRLRDDLSFVADKAFQTLTATYLRRAFDPRIAVTSLEMEGRALLLADRLLQLHDSPHVRVTSQSGGLSPGHLRRVCDFIIERLAKDIRLADLAELTGLTGKHFARAFKQSTGLPPHQYLIVQRIEAAKRCLIDGRASLIEIALECGFTDQSQFTATFRKAVGVSPGSWRRDHMK